MNSLKTAGDLLSLLLSFRMMRSQGKGTVQAKLLEDPEAPVMRLEESHNKQTPNLNKREWGLHQHSQKVHPDSLSLTCTIHTLTHPHTHTRTHNEFCCGIELLFLYSDNIILLKYSRHMSRELKKF